MWLFMSCVFLRLRVPPLCNIMSIRTSALLSKPVMVTVGSWSWSKFSEKCVQRSSCRLRCFTRESKTAWSSCSRRTPSEEASSRRRWTLVGGLFSMHRRGRPTEKNSFAWFYLYKCYPKEMCSRLRNLFGKSKILTHTQPRFQPRYSPLCSMSIPVFRIKFLIFLEITNAQYLSFTT